RDDGADVLKLAILLISAASMPYIWPFLRERGLYKGEVAVRVLFAVAGMMLLVSAGNLTVSYVGLEPLPPCAFALVATDRDSPLASAAAMKHFVRASLASGLLPYGRSLDNGATGTLDLGQIRVAATGLAGEDRVLLLT